MGIDFFRPGKNAAYEIFHITKASRAQEFDCLGAAHSGAAMHYGFPIRIEFAKPLWQVIERDQVPANISGLVLIGFADVEHEDVVVGIQSLFEVFCVHVWEIGQVFSSAADGRPTTYLMIENCGSTGILSVDLTVSATLVRQNANSLFLEIPLLFATA